MKAIFIALFVLVAAVSASKYNYKYDNDRIAYLDRNNFDQCQKDFDYILIKFWSPSCSYSKRFAPEFIRARSLIHGGDYDRVTFAQVNIKIETGIAKKYNVRSTPATRLFNKRQNKWINYDGSRDCDSLVSWVKKHVYSDCESKNKRSHHSDSDCSIKSIRSKRFNSDKDCSSSSSDRKSSRHSKKYNSDKDCTSRRSNKC